MNLVFVNSTRKWGGVKTWTLEAALGLAGLGHKVWIFARPGPFVDKARDLGLAAIERYFGFDYNPAAIAWFMRFLKTERVDRLIVNVGKDMRTAGIAARLAKVPTVLRVGLPRDMKNTPKVRMTHAFVKPSVLAPCEFIKQGLTKHLPFISPDTVKVIHTGKTPISAAPRTVNRPLRLIATSQLNPDKGHADLLTGLAALQSEGRSFTLTVLGTGESEPELKKMCAKLGLAGKVSWLGFQPDVAAHLAKADVFVLPSLSEGLPNSLLEAMAHGLVLAARAVGGVPEAWPEEMKDLMFGPGTHGLINVLGRILAAGDDEILKWKAAALDKCRRDFNLETQTRALAAWLEGLGE